MQEPYRFLPPSTDQTKGLDGQSTTIIQEAWLQHYLLSIYICTRDSKWNTAFDLRKRVARGFFVVEVLAMMSRNGEDNPIQTSQSDPDRCRRLPGQVGGRQVSPVGPR